MTTDLSWAFGQPEDRAIATHQGDPLDRIAVRDFIKEVEIGAFQAERGVTQRVQFNVVLEVARSAAAAFDDVDQVLSYDTITEAIEHQLAAERLNLLETLAERIAGEVLSNPRAQRIFIRIEKLDRIPGALGVEIVRTRAADTALHVVSDAPQAEVDRITPMVVYMPNSVLNGDQLGAWLDAIAAHPVPAIICLDPSPNVDIQTGLKPADRRITLLSIEQNAWVLAAKDPRCVVVNSRTELDWAVQQEQMSVWAPSKIVMDAVEKPEMLDAAALSQWLAAGFDADICVACGPDTGAFPHIAATPEALVEHS